MRTICNHIVFFCIILIGAISFAEEKCLFADKVEYNKKEDYIEATGNVKIIFQNYTLTSDRILYDIENNEVYTYGNVKAFDGSKHIAMGDSAIIKNNAKNAIVNSFILYFKQEDTIIAGRIGERINKNKTHMHKASLTSCPACKNKKPLWQISAKKVEILHDKKQVIYKNMFFEIYGIPVLYSPYFSHPLPGAKPKSGILVPNIKHKRPGLPIYFRPKSNMDFTFTPRMTKKNIYYDLELRHLTKKGSYKIGGSVLSSKENAPVTSEGRLKHFRKIRRYNAKGGGNFSHNKNHYGFNFDRVSDKDFLREYEKRHAPFLASNLYAYRVSKGNYIQINNTSLQGMNKFDSNPTDPYITPEIDFRYALPFENSNSIVTASNNTSIYHTTKLGNITRSFTTLTFQNSNITKFGQVFGFEIYNRIDLYRFNLNTKTNQKENKSTYSRSIPEARIFSSYPITGRIFDKRFLFEPMTHLSIGFDKEYTTKKIKYIDSEHYEFNDINFLKSNRHNGYDFHESGQRLTYGTRGAVNIDDEKKLGLFVGQMQRLSRKIQSKPDLVGRTYLNLKEHIEIYYRFRKNSRNYASIFDEIGTWYKADKLKLDLSYVNLKNKKITGKDKIRQLYFNTSYEANTNWIFGYHSRFDISSRRAKQLSQGIRVTYRGDCVSISSYIANDYMEDSSKGIGKKNDFTLKLGLKTINM